jgi:hypothetical protein
MSYRDSDVFSDVIDVLDNIRDNVDCYLAGIQQEDEQATGDSTNKKSDLGTGNQAHSLVAAALVSSPERLYIKDNGPLVMRLSESLQSVLRDVVERQQRGVAGVDPAAAAGPTAEAARNDAVRALVTRKLGELMENAHTMRSVVKQQQQRRRSQRFRPLPSSSGDDGAAGNDQRMRNLLRVIAHDLEDTERLLRIAFPEASSPTASAPASSASPPRGGRSSPAPALSASGSSYSPERRSISTTNACSASDTPRHSTSTAPYVRRSESLDTSRPPQPSPPSSAAAPAVGDADDTTRTSALRSLDASGSFGAQSMSQPAKSQAPRVHFVLDHTDTTALSNDDDDDDGGSDDELHGWGDRAGTSGLMSNPIHLRRGSGSGNASTSTDGGGGVVNSAASRVGRSFSSVIGGVMQLAPFVRRRPSLTVGTTAPAAAEGRGGEKKEGTEGTPRLSGGHSPAASSTSISSLENAKQTKPYTDALHIIAASEVPRGILKTSSSRVGSSTALNEGAANESTSRSSALSSPGSGGRPMVQFRDEVLDHPGNAESSNHSGTSNNNSTGDGSGGFWPSTTTGTSNNSSTSSSLGNGRQRGLPAGLPPRSPRLPETLPVPHSIASGQRPPLAPTSSTSTSLSIGAAPPPTRNVWVTTSHWQRLPGELWGDILATNRAEMTNVLREDVIDLFNYGEEEPVLHLDDVTDVNFRFADQHLHIRFDLEHLRSLTESEVNLRLGLCSYPLMTGLYEEYFQAYHAHEFEPIEESTTTLSNLTTPMKGSVRLSISCNSPSYREGKDGGSGDPHRLANTLSLPLPTPQTLSPTAQDDCVPVVSPLSIAADVADSHTASLVSDSAASFSSTPHTSSVEVAMQPSSSTLAAAVGAVAAPAKTTKNELTTPRASGSSPVPSVNDNGNTETAPLSAAVPRRTQQRSSKNDSLLTVSVPFISAGSSSTSFAVAARQRDGLVAATASSPHTSSSPSTPAALASPAKSAGSSNIRISNNNARIHAHTVCVPGQHWEAVTALVPEDDLADAFLVDVSAALSVLPSEARASCQHVRFYLGSLVVKFRWNNAELYPGAVPLTAADVDSKLATYTFPSLRQVYATSCAALHLTDDITTDIKDVAAPSPAAQFTLPNKAELDDRCAEESPLLESSTLRDHATMQHRGEGAPSRSPSLSNTLSGNGDSITLNAQATKSTPDTPQSLPAPRESSPDPVAATHLHNQRARSNTPDSNTSAEVEPRAATPAPTKLSVSPRSLSNSQQRHSHSPVRLTQARKNSGLTSSATAATAAVPPRQVSRSRSRDGAHRAPSPQRKEPASDVRPPPAATTATSKATTNTTTLNRLARQHNVSLRTLLQWNPALAQVDPDKLVAIPNSFVVPRKSAPPTQSTPAAAAVTESQASTDTQAAPASAAPRSISARRRHDGGIIASLRSRPRLTPKESSASAETESPVAAPAAEPAAQKQVSPSAAEKPLPTAAARHADPSPTSGTATPVAAAALEKQEGRSRGTPSTTLFSRMPPPLSVADVEARRTPRAHVATYATAVATAKTAEHTNAAETHRPDPATITTTAAAAVLTTSRTSKSCEEGANSLEHLAYSHTTATRAQASVEAPPPAEKQQLPTTVLRLLEASPRSAQAAAATTTAGSPSPLSELKVYHLPPEVLGLDPMLIPSDPVQSPSEYLSVSRSARRQHPQQASPQQVAIPEETASRGKHSSNSNNNNSSEADDLESFSALVIEHELGVRLNGLLVEDVRKKGIAAEAGFQVGDTLHTMDGQILASGHDFHRGLLQQQQQQKGVESDRTCFVTAVNARGNPITYRLRIPATAAADAVAGVRRLSATSGTARKASAASTATVTSSSSTTPPPHSSLQPPASKGRDDAELAAARRALLAPPTRSQVASSRRQQQRQQQQQQSSGGTPGGPPKSSPRPAPAPAVTVSRSEAAKTTSAARLRVSSIGAMTRETRAQSSHSIKVLRETEAPSIVHFAASRSSASLSARRAGRDNESGAHAHALFNQ